MQTDFGYEVPKEYIEKFEAHTWVSPPRDVYDRTRFSVKGPRLDSLTKAQGYAFDAFTDYGPMGLRDLSKLLTVNPSEACRILTGLAAAGSLRDRSSSAEARAAKWKADCATVAGIASQGAVSMNFFTRASEEAGVKHPKICMLYLIEAGLLIRSEARHGTVYYLPAEPGADDMLRARSPLTVKTGPAEARVLEFLSERPLTVAEICERLDSSRARAWEMKNRMREKRLMEKLDFMGERFLRRADMDENEGRFRLIQSGRVPDPSRLRATISKALESGLPLSLTAAAEATGCSIPAVRYVMDQMAESGEARWEAEGVLAGPETTVSPDLARRMPVRRFQNMLVAALKLGSFTSIEMNRFLNATVEPTPDRPNRCCDMENRHGFLTGFNDDEVDDGTWKARTYTLTEKGREMAEAVCGLPHMQETVEAMDLETGATAGPKCP